MERERLNELLNQYHIKIDNQYFIDEKYKKLIDYLNENNINLSKIWIPMNETSIKEE